MPYGGLTVDVVDKFDAQPVLVRNDQAVLPE
jgi:hypothetical protein